MFHTVGSHAAAEGDGEAGTIQDRQEERFLAVIMMIDAPKKKVFIKLLQVYLAYETRLTLPYSLQIMVHASSTLSSARFNGSCYLTSRKHPPDSILALYSLKRGRSSRESRVQG